MNRYQFKFRQSGGCTLVDVSPKPDWGEFDDFIQQFLNDLDAKLVEQDLGMDRHQVRYRVADKQYVLQFEHYTDSIWVERDY